jgi:hypothetical protein
MPAEPFPIVFPMMDRWHTPVCRSCQVKLKKKIRSWEKI